VARDRGETSTSLAMFVVTSVIVIAIPAILLLHERSRPALRVPVQAAGVVVSSAPATLPSTSAGSSAAPKIGLAAPVPSARQAPTAPTATPPAPGATSVVPLAALITLPPAGFVASVQEDGRSLQVPTLEFCGTAFPSEAQRAERLAISWSDDNGSGPTIEAVRYTAGGAALADAEAVNALRHCPQTYTEELLPVLHTDLEPANSTLTPTQVSFVQEVQTGSVQNWFATILLFDGSYLASVSSDFAATAKIAYESALEVATRESVVLQAVLSRTSPAPRALSG
jgi:hypothetical protein